MAIRSRCCLCLRKAESGISRVAMESDEWWAYHFERREIVVMIVLDFCSDAKIAWCRRLNRMVEFLRVGYVIECEGWLTVE
jgi:hypothetical protein